MARSRPRYRLRFRSLEGRIWALSMLAFGVVLLLVSVSMNWAIGARAEEKVGNELTASAAMIDRVWSMRNRELEGVAQPLALDYGFREAIASDDDATIRSALANLAGRIDLPSAFVVKYDGRVIGLTPGEDARYDAELWDELDAGWHSGALRIRGKTYQAVAAEIRAPALIGWLVIGRRLDQAEVRDLATLSAIPVHVAIVRRVGGDRWVFDESNRPVNNPGVANLLSQLSAQYRGLSDSFAQRIGENMVLVRTLGGSDGEATTAMILDFSIVAALAEYNGLRWAVLAAAVAGLALVAFTTIRLARHIVHPLVRLEKAVQNLGQGAHTSVPVESEDEIGRLSASFNAMSQEILHRENRIRHMAFHDALTDLPNRPQLVARIEQALLAITRNRGNIALLCLDLDHFKVVNDTLGHQVGDELLLAVATRIVDTAGGHFVARSGGDEFWILVEGGEARDVAPDLARLLMAELEKPLRIGENVMRPAVSIGLAFAPGDSMRADDLIKHADLAMHQAKQDGRRRVVQFTAEFDERAQARRELEVGLHGALANGEFEVHFQPLFDLRTNRYCAFEALLRWNHPEKGLISPVDFIPVAEETGMIVPIGEWVLREACRIAAEWPDNIRVAVNFSTVQFHSPSLTGTILSALTASGLPADRLEVEITESLFLESTGKVTDTLRSLKRIGCRIALDDFGTGFSSLSYLRTYPFDKIKIDRSFIIELLEKDEAGAVVKAITDLAAALNMETTAEGVEEPEQVEALRRHGCTNVQGYLFSRAIPEAAVAELLGIVDERASAG